jgi:hypothetical protein
MILQIAEKYEPLYSIPVGSVVELENGERVHYLSCEEEEETGGWFCVLKNDGRIFELPPGTPGKYICSIIDWEGLAFRT